MKTVVVVPSYREESLRTWLEAWREPLKNVQVVVVWDGEKSPDLKTEMPDPKWSIATWRNIKCLGDDEWIIPRRTSAIRSYGFLVAAKEMKADVIVTMDDDCLPDEQGVFIAEHLKRLETSEYPAWSIVGNNRTRGVPYHNLKRVRPALINCGLWKGVPDYDAPTALHAGKYPAFTFNSQTIAAGSYFPMCGMNLSFRREALPMMYFGLQGGEWPYDRFDDIWCGVIAKKICDHLGWGVNVGFPAVRHEKASNVWQNLQKEAPGMEVNEWFWDHIDRIILTGTTVGECFNEVAMALPQGEYWTQLRQAMITWRRLTEGKPK